MSPTSASTATVEAGVSRIAASENDRYGGCAALLDVSLDAAGLDCPHDWVTLDCRAAAAGGDGGRMVELLRAALAVGKPVALTVSDDDKRDGYCRASRITVQDSPFVDVDSDADGVSDLDDDLPLNAFETRDTDDDGIGDIVDDDDDNDGVPDVEDAFPNDPAEWQDSDGDGIGNGADLDDDGDGLPDAEDVFPLGNVAVDLHHGSDDPVGVVAAVDRLFVLDGVDQRVYAYHLTGEREPARDFDLEPDDRDLQDIAYASGYFYVLYEHLNIVEAYALSGKRAPERDITLLQGLSYLALDYDDGLFRIVQDRYHSHSVYTYTELGEHAPGQDFDLDLASIQPRAIVHRAGVVYILDREGKAYAYSADGERRPPNDFELGWRDVTGATHVADRFYLSYRRRPTVAAYGSVGRRAPAYDFDLGVGTNDTPTGLGYADGRFYVADGDEAKVFVYSASGAYLPAADFGLSSAGVQGATVVDGTFLVGEGIARVRAYDLTGRWLPFRDLRLDGHVVATGVEFALGRFYVGNAHQKRLQAYTVQGKRAQRYDIPVRAGPSGPRGIAYGNGRFYTGDGLETQIFAYDASGRHLPDHDFDLGEPFRDHQQRHAPSGIAFADDAVYVLDWRRDRILPYRVK